MKCVWFFPLQFNEGGEVVFCQQIWWFRALSGVRTGLRREMVKVFGGDSHAE